MTTLSVVFGSGVDRTLFLQYVLMQIQFVYIHTYNIYIHTFLFFLFKAESRLASGLRIVQLDKIGSVKGRNQEFG